MKIIGDLIKNDEVNKIEIKLIRNKIEVGNYLKCFEFIELN